MACMQAIYELDERMKRAKQVLHSFKVEMRELPRDEAMLYDTVSCWCVLGG